MTALFKFTHLFSGTPGLCAVWAFPSYGEWGCSLAVALGFLMAVASCYRAWALGHVGSSNWGSRAYLLLGTWDLPGAGIILVSPTLADGFLTTGPLGKSLETFLQAP